mmetsp:Transcript_26997/g.46039  ORF Transcript_26997/g.46039 Transcript_26997/m.46039 type:complete len:117 (+) Transcript_26997:60-410(+)
MLSSFSFFPSMCTPLYDVIRYPTRPPKEHMPLSSLYLQGTTIIVATLYDRTQKRIVRLLLSIFLLPFHQIIIAIFQEDIVGSKSICRCVNATKVQSAKLDIFHDAVKYSNGVRFII